MRIRSSWAGWMAARQLKRGRYREAMRWYERLGAPRMAPEQRLAYARLLHEHGHTPRALGTLDEWLAASPNAEGFACRASFYQDVGKEREAASDLSAAIRLDAASPQYWHARAMTYNALGEYDKAVADLQEAIARLHGAGLVTAYYELGCVCLRADRAEEAIDALSRAAGSLEYAIPLHRFRLSEAFESAGRGQEALAAVRIAADAQSRLLQMRDRGEAYMRERTHYAQSAVRTMMAVIDGEYGFRLKESQLLEDAGNPEAALVSIDAALRDYPGEEDLLLRRGALLRANGRSEEAVRLLSRVREHNPERLAAYTELFASYRALERWPEAIGSLRQALERFPRQMVVRFWLVDAYRDSGAEAEAWSASRELTELEPEDPLNWRQRAELAIDMRKFAEADEAYTRAIELDPTAEYYMRRSFARYMDDRNEDALLDLQSAIEKDPALHDQARTAYAAAELYMGMGNRELAEQEYGRAIRLDPDNPHLLERRAQCRFGMKRLAEALEDCRAGLRLDPGHVRLLRLQGYIHWRLEQYELALHDLQAYVRKMPDDEQGHRDLANVYARLNMYDEASGALSRALELSPFEAPLYLDRASLFYHHLFERDRAAEDLAQWLLYAGIERPNQDRFEMLSDLDGFDDEVREAAMEKYLSGYGASRYLS